jgi:hypothetical protein
MTAAQLRRQRLAAESVVTIFARIVARVEASPGLPVHGMSDAEFDAVLQHPDASALVSTEEATAIQAACHDCLLAGCSTREDDGTTRVALGPVATKATFMHARVLVEKNAEDSRFLSQILSLVIHLTSKSTASLIRARDDLSESRIGTRGPRRICTICGPFVAWAWTRLLGPSRRGPDTFWHALLGDGAGPGTEPTTTPLFAAACYRSIREHKVDARLGIRLARV